MEKMKIVMNHKNGSMIYLDSKDDKSSQELIKTLKKMLKIINKKK